MKVTYHVPTTKQDQEQLKAIVERLFPGSTPTVTERAIGTLNINWQDLDSLADLLRAKIEYGPFVTFTIEELGTGYSEEQERFLRQPGIESHRPTDMQSWLDDLE